MKWYWTRKGWQDLWDILKNGTYDQLVSAVEQLDVADRRIESLSNSLTEQDMSLWATKRQRDRAEELMREHFTFEEGLTRIYIAEIILANKERFNVAYTGLYFELEDGTVISQGQGATVQVPFNGFPTDHAESEALMNILHEKYNAGMINYIPMEELGRASIRLVDWIDWHIGPPLQPESILDDIYKDTSEEE